MKIKPGDRTDPGLLLRRSRSLGPSVGVYDGVSRFTFYPATAKARPENVRAGRSVTYGYLVSTKANRFPSQRLPTKTGCCVARL